MALPEDPHELAQLVRNAAKELDDSDNIGQQVVSLAKQAKDLAQQFLKLRGSATEKGASVFDQRLAAAVAKVASATQLSQAEWQVFSAFVAAINPNK